MQHFLSFSSDALQCIVNGLGAFLQKLGDRLVIRTHQVQIQNMILKGAQSLFELINKRLRILSPKIQRLGIILLFRLDRIDQRNIILLPFSCIIQGDIRVQRNMFLSF